MDPAMKRIIVPASQDGPDYSAIALLVPEAAEKTQTKDYALLRENARATLVGQVIHVKYLNVKTSVTAMVYVKQANANVTRAGAEKTASKE